MIARLNRWNDTTKAMELATSLKGPAVSILTDLEPEHRRDYGRLVSALTARFEPDNQSEVFRAQLKGKRRRGQEALAELAQDVRTLTRKAYPSADLTIRETIARDCFIDALNDAELEWSVYREKPASLTDALTTALEHEAFKTGRLKRTAGANQVVRAQQEITPKKQESEADRVLERLVAFLENREKSPKPARDRKDSPKGKGACFYCGSRDHYIAKCEKKQQDRANKSNSQGNGSTSSAATQAAQSTADGTTTSPSLSGNDP